MKKITLLFLLIATFTFAQEKEQKIVLITLDGLRWQELFTGADEKLVNNKAYVSNTEGLKKMFWENTPKLRREALFPFLWDYVAKNGQLHGNRDKGSKVNLTNSMWFSYPGYNEILTGNADDKNIKSNDKIYNPNTTILELLNSTNDFKGEVAAFGSWDVFPYIINDKRSGVPVNAGFRNAEGDLTDREKFLNQLQSEIPSPWGTVRLDAFTHHFAKEYMKSKHPKIVYVAYGETDDFAHDGDYEAYLKSAHTTDSFIKDLWEFTQEDEFYKDNTTFIITTDHGRGTHPLETWKSHGSDINGADEVWILAFGKNASALGEVKIEEQLYSNQVAPTILKILGVEDAPKNMNGSVLEMIRSKE
ncbi:sulfatase-like hydrolase/transferase [Joostella atrarenae]|uniref:Sulfatase-like hydrolase/transferase n=1 Tax=Joostella atrarenae TaxID=679257 RepID=A0ABS9J6H7_9FLAO|nr:alkaline phosphatase family protein [Joostella atrarenae]MCF8716009.1 sulfatase-like hydrolase/transferase [Joostella atrarenae]